MGHQVREAETLCPSAVYPRSMDGHDDPISDSGRETRSEATAERSVDRERVDAGEEFDATDAADRESLEPGSPSLENALFVLLGVVGTLTLLYGTLML